MSPRRHVPPFEIMGSSPPTPPTLPGDGARAPRATLGERWRGVVSGLSGDRLGQWWTQANRPVVLRMPRGYLVLAAAGTLLLIALAYWAGSVRGHLRAISEMEAGTVPPGMIRDPGEQTAAPTAPAGSVLRDRSTAAPEAAGRDDPRTPGLNYLILARYPLDEAQRLIAFLKGQGVDAVGIPAHTRGLYLVVALQGFDRTQYNAEPGTRFKEQMQRIGRAWKAHNNNRGDDLASMYYERYDPKDP